MAIPTILKGETAKPIPLALAEGYDYAGCSLHVDFCGTRSTFVDLGAGGSLELRFTAEQTAAFPLGTSKAMLSLENAAGKIRFMPWAKIKVTDSPADLYDAAITIDPATLDVDDLTRSDPPDVVKSRVNAILAFLRGLKVVALALIPLGILADVTPKYAISDYIPGDMPIMTNVEEFVEAKMAEAGKVKSVNGRTGAVVLSAPDVGALAADGTAFRASSVGSAERWTDATGCVWQATFDVARDWWTIEPAESAGGMSVFWDGDSWVLRYEGYNNDTGHGADVYSFGFRLEIQYTATRHPGGAATLVDRVALQSQIPGDYANVSNRAVNAVGVDAMPTIEGYAFTNWYNNITMTNPDGYLSIHTNIVVQVGPIGSGVRRRLFAGWRLGLSDTFWEELAGSETDPTVSEWAKAETKPTYTASEVGAATPADLETATNALGVALRGEIPTVPSNVSAFNNDAGYITGHTETDPVATPKIAALSNEIAVIAATLGDSARFIVTNYDSTANIASASVEANINGVWREIWDETTRWNWLLGEYLPPNFYTKSEIDAMLDGKADRAWGFFDSHTGTYAPEGYTSISSPSILIAGGMAYQRTLTTEGAVWVLTANGMTAQTVGSTNGTFRIEDTEGNVHFEIVKGDKREVGADADSVVTLTAYSPQALQIHYSVDASEHPVIEVSLALGASADWKAESAADCAANVSWSGHSGDWTAIVQPKSATSTLFCRATYSAGGETYIRNSAPVAMQYIMLGGTKYELGTATINGHTVLTLTLP